jgi:hypothetical protein
MINTNEQTFRHQGIYHGQWLIRSTFDGDRFENEGASMGNARSACWEEAPVG